MDGKGTPLLKEIAYQKIKESILTEEFAPGQFLSERELIEMLQMSKTPIKSALVRLETEGFVTVSSKQGIIINDLSVEKITDIYNLRTALETYVCEQICGKLTAEQISLLQSNLQETEECVRNLDAKAFTEKDHAFHQLLCRFSGNQEIYRVLLNYYDHLKRITLRHLNKDPHRMKRFWTEHREMFDCLVKGDPKAIQLMKDHLQNSKVMLFM